MSFDELYQHNGFGYEYVIGEDVADLSSFTNKLIRLACLTWRSKILPIGKEVTSDGICSSKNGVLEIKSCRDLPIFLSQWTKDQMVIELSSKTKSLLWSYIVVGSVLIFVLGCAIVRNIRNITKRRARRWKDCGGNIRNTTKKIAATIIEQRHTISQRLNLNFEVDNNCP